MFIYFGGLENVYIKKIQILIFFLLTIQYVFYKECFYKISNILISD